VSSLTIAGSGQNRIGGLVFNRILACGLGGGEPLFAEPAVRPSKPLTTRFTCKLQFPFRECLCGQRCSLHDFPPSPLFGKGKYYSHDQTNNLRCTAIKANLVVRELRRNNVKCLGVSSLFVARVLVHVYICVIAIRGNDTPLTVCVSHRRPMFA
jgi:hypothetical protein